MSEPSDSLRDVIERRDASSANYAEHGFASLNRVAGPYRARMRGTLDEWFTRYPDGPDRRDLRERFRDKNPGRHQSAWWELCLHELLLRLGYTIEVHPSLEDTDAHPDFAISTGGETMLLEAAVVFSGIVEEGRDGTREGWILDALNRTQAPGFFLGVRFDQVGRERPKVAEITKPIEQWLATHDPDGITATARPELPLTIRDWRLRVDAMPVSRSTAGASITSPVTVSSSRRSGYCCATAARRPVTRT